MTSGSPSFRTIIQHRRITGFVGREAQLALFRDNLTVPPDSDRRRFLFSIHGDGGVGKSFLLDRMRQAAGEAGRLTAVVDESYDAPEAMAAIARALEEQGVRLKRFGRRYAAYHKRAGSPGEAEPERPSGAEQAASLVTQTAVRVGLGAARELPGGNLLTGAVKPDDAAQRLDGLRSDAARKWRERDDRFAAPPVEALTRQFLDNLRQVGRPVALFFDTYERSGAHLDGWLRGLFDGTWGDLPADVVVAVAGRFPLDPARWAAYLGVHVDLPLAPFTATEARQLLAQRDITDERVIEEILAASGGLPLSLAMLAAAPPPGPAAGAGPPLDAAAVGDVTDSIVDRFLQWEPSPELQEIALAAALPRHVDLDILAVLLGPAGPGPERAYGWLTAQAFVARTAGRCQYHAIVRDPMLRLYRTRSAQRWAARHAALAAAYHQWRTAMSGDDRDLWQRPDWQERLFEEIYHRLCADPGGALPEVLEHAVNACWHDGPLARLAETITQAGRDAGTEDLAALGEAFAAALDGDDRFAYLDVILARTEATPATRASAYRERGRRHRLAERYDQAMADYDRALGTSPAYGEAFVGRGETNRLMGRLDAAVADLTRAIELDPSDGWAIGTRGQAYASLDRRAEALADFDRAIALDPDLDWVIAERGETYRQMGRYDEALADLTRAIDLDPDSAWAIGSRTQTYRAMNRYDEALAGLNGIIERHPEHGWAFTDRGQLYLEMGRYDEALADLTRALELAPADAGNTYALGVRGQAHRAMDRFDDALADFDQAVELDPDLDWVIAERGETYRMMGRDDDALADLTRAVELDPGYAWAYAHRGETYQVMDRVEEALADLDRAIELDPDYAWALASRGLRYRLMGRYDDAITDLSRLLELSPAYAWGFAERGEAYRQAHRYDEALADFDRAIELDADYAWAIAGRGQVYRALRRNEAALADLNRALEREPELDWALVERADTYQAMGRHAEALADLDRVLAADPDDTWALGSRAETYRLLGRYDEALADADRAIGLRPDKDWLHTERAAVLRRLGRYADATAALDRAIELDPYDLSRRTERALTGNAPPTARYQCVVTDLPITTLSQARAAGESITTRLLEDGIIGPPHPATSPVPGCHPPGPAAPTTTATAAGAADDDGRDATTAAGTAALGIGGASTDAPPPYGEQHPASYGFAVITAPDGIPSLPARTATCPSCTAALPLRDGDHPAAFTEDVLDAASIEGHSGAGPLRCPSCRQASPVRTWTFTPPWAFGSLAFCFWNWPPLRPEFIESLSTHLGHPVALITGEL